MCAKVAGRSKSRVKLNAPRSGVLLGMDMDESVGMGMEMGLCLVCT